MIIFSSLESWLAIAFYFLLLFVSKPALKKINEVLNQRSIKIKNDLENCSSLQQETAKLLDECQKKRFRINSEISKIQEETELNIKSFKEKKDREVENTINKKRNQLIHKIKSYESRIIHELKTEAINKIVRIVTLIAQEHNK